MDIRLRLSRKRQWDREIIKWLEHIPAGYRATEIKRTLFELISCSSSPHRDTAKPLPGSSEGQDREPPDFDIKGAISKLVKH